MAMPGNSALAYNLEEYEQQEPKVRAPQLKVVKTPKRFLTSLVTPKNVCMLLVAVGIFCAMIFNNAQLNEITGQISAQSKDLQLLQSEYVQLQSQLEAKMSLRTVAELAENELGMKRLGEFQTEYICLYQQDKIETSAAYTGGISIKMKTTFNSAVEKLKEYIVNR